MDRSIKNIAWIALCAILESLQWVIFIALIYSFIPIPVDDFYNTLFPFKKVGLYQKRDMFFYRIFILAAAGVQTGLVLFYRKSLNDEQTMSRVRAWIVMGLITIIPQLFLIYQFWLGPHPQQARGALCAICAMALAIRIFWPEVYAWAVKFIGKRRVIFKFQSWKSIGQFWLDHQDAIVLALLSLFYFIQVYLYAFAVIGLHAHRELWPSSNPWAYVALGFLCLVVSIIAVLMGARRMILRDFKRRHLTRTIVEGLISFFLLSALFKLHVFYYQPLLAQRVYIDLLILSVIIKVCWPLVENFLRSMSTLVMNEENMPALRLMANVGFVVFIFLFFYVPDMEAAMARVFMGEQFHAIDACLMNTGWAYHAGCKLDVDINNRYGLGMAVMISWISNLFGGFSYQSVFTIVMLACIVYFMIAYGLLRWWLKSVPLAIAGILIILKMQPLHEETASFYLTNPSTTVCRYFFDLPFLFMVLLFLRTFKKYFLLLAAGICSIALFYASDTGVYLTMAFYASLVLIYSFKELRAKLWSGSNNLGFVSALMLVPPAGALALLRLTQGPMVFSKQFWLNMAEYIRSQMWYGPIHIWESLRAHDWWLFGMGMWIVIAYVFTLIFVGTLIYLKKVSHEHFFVLVLCIYGLALYHYYINRSAVTNCYTGILPYVFILCYWVKTWGERLNVMTRKRFYLIFIGLCLYGLWTTHLTVAYPNVFNFSRNPAVDPLVASKLSKGRLGYFNQLFIQYPDAFKLPVNSLGETNEDWRTEDDFTSDDQLKAYYQKEFNFPEDASLIDGLTKPEEPVALISSFEIQMLIQAGRKPFFYIFPLVNSRPMRMRLFEVTHMWTITQMNDTIKQLVDQKPGFVFMERIYLAPEIPSAYLYDMPAICELVNFVRQHYEPYRTGKYLVAMKLRGTNL